MWPIHYYSLYMQFSILLGVHHLSVKFLLDTWTSLSLSLSAPRRILYDPFSVPQSAPLQAASRTVLLLMAIDLTLMWCVEGVGRVTLQRPSAWWAGSLAKTPSGSIPCLSRTGNTLFSAGSHRSFSAHNLLLATNLLFSWVEETADPRNRVADMVPNDAFGLCFLFLFPDRSNQEVFQALCCLQTGNTMCSAPPHRPPQWSVDGNTELRLVVEFAAAN